MATTDYFYIGNPLDQSLHEINIPIDSVALIGMPVNALSGVYMPSIFLNKEYSTEHGYQWLNWYLDWESSGIRIMDSAFPLIKYGLTLTRFYTGYVPFDVSFTAEIHGFSRTFGSETPRTAKRHTYEKPDGSTFIVDTYTLAMGELLFDLWIEDESVQRQHTIGCYIARDSEGTILGGYSTGWAKTVYIKVGTRTKQVYCPRLEEETMFGTLPYTPYKCAENSYINGTSYIVPPDEATEVGTATDVSITDYFYYSPITPITFPVRIKGSEKSYSFIQL